MTQLTRPTRAEVAAELRAAGCVFAEDEARLLDESAADAARLRELVERRVAGAPLEPLLGWVEFGGLRLEVGPSVFVPRRRTEALAIEAARLAAEVPRSVVVDLCGGVGAIAAFVAASVPVGRVVSADLDPLAVTFAARNLAPYGGEAYAGDLYQALPRELMQQIHVLAVNAPYVPTAEIGAMPREAREYEPRSALDGGSDGLDLHRRVAAEAAAWVAPGGHVLIETSRAQSRGTRDLLDASGFVTRLVTDDDRDAAFVVGRATRI